MSLIGALNIGKSALATQQAALQVTGNNISNAGNADFTRQNAQVLPQKDTQLRPGVFVGNGINLTAVQRQIDEALQGRLRGSISDSESADATQQWLGRVEAIFNELSDEDLSTQMSKFFNSWSNLANKPQDIGLRQVVIQNGQSVATWINNLRGDLGNLQVDVDNRLKALTANADQLAGQLADLNGQIVTAEGGSGGQANALRDQRDAVLKQLSQLMDIKTVPQANGVVNVYVGSAPLVVNTDNRGVGLRQETINGNLQSTVIIKADNSAMKLTSGQLGALSQVRSGTIDQVIGQMDDLAHNLIYELNKLHASGQGLQGFSSVTAGSVVSDPTKALNDPASGLKFIPTNGSFVVHVKQKSTGLSTSTLMQVDLDGLNANDTTLNALTTGLDAITGVAATVVGGQLKINAESDNVEISFSQDSSGVLAALGINTFFNGSNARDIEVNQTIADSPALLAAAKNGESADNQTARSIADLEGKSLASLSNTSFKERYQAMVNGVAVSAAAAKTNAEAASVVNQTLQSQRESLSGVSLDEEAINLMKQQRAFQAAARLVSAIDEMMRTVLQMT
ncbi:MAG: flagellar hook-associated protein FlgK [Phycisphaerales bacterium]|jgi:flagellar hook-associated protein 1 FlgK|nr:flagellar hook-associated protein FlgK [Phycisphaerales bacterium]